MLKCADKQCPSRRVCARYTSAKKLACGTFGRVKGADKCAGYVELFPKIKHVKQSKKIVDTMDIVP